MSRWTSHRGGHWSPGEQPGFLRIGSGWPGSGKRGALLGSATSSKDPYSRPQIHRETTGLSPSDLDARRILPCSKARLLTALWKLAWERIPTRDLGLFGTKHLSRTDPERFPNRQITRGNERQQQHRGRREIHTNSEWAGVVQGCAEQSARGDR